METASFTGFLKAVIYIIAFYYIFKFLARIFMPLILKKVVEKAGQNFQQQYHNQRTQQQQQYNSQPEQDVYNSPKTKNFRSTKKVGEYVDYEEIE